MSFSSVAVVTTPVVRLHGAEVWAPVGLLAGTCG